MGTVTPAGQVTVPPSRSITKRSLGKWPFGAGGGWHLLPLWMPAPSSRSEELAGAVGGIAVDRRPGLAAEPVPS